MKALLVMVSTWLLCGAGLAGYGGWMAFQKAESAIHELVALQIWSLGGLAGGTAFLIMAILTVNPSPPPQKS